MGTGAASFKRVLGSSATRLREPLHSLDHKRIELTPDKRCWQSKGIRGGTIREHTSELAAKRIGMRRDATSKRLPEAPAGCVARYLKREVNRVGKTRPKDGVGI